MPLPEHVFKYNIEVPLDVWTSEAFAPPTVEMLNRGDERTPIEMPVESGILYIYLQRHNSLQHAGVDVPCLEIMDAYISLGSPQEKNIWIDFYHQINLIGYGQVWFGIWVKNVRSRL